MLAVGSLLGGRLSQAAKPEGVIAWSLTLAAVFLVVLSQCYGPLLHWAAGQPLLAGGNHGRMDRPGRAVAGPGHNNARHPAPGRDYVGAMGRHGAGRRKRRWHRRGASPRDCCCPRPSDWHARCWRWRRCWPRRPCPRPSAGGAGGGGLRLDRLPRRPVAGPHHEQNRVIQPLHGQLEVRSDPLATTL